MKVILLKDVKGVGRRFEEKEVADGFALNRLIPQKFAVPANGPGAKQVKLLKEQAQASKAKGEEKLSQTLSQIAGKTITVSMKANDAGVLFSSLNAEKLSRLLKEEKGIELAASTLKLYTPIKETGTFEVPVSVGGGAETRFTLEISQA